VGEVWHCSDDLIIIHPAHVLVACPIIEHTSNSRMLGMSSSDQKDAWLLGSRDKA
jgi:hypothetical protein